ncbi:MAG: MMPL family transporter, partial [Algicola sp.]|nr:MMPL family transporter [Algicola sp.]
TMVAMLTLATTAIVPIKIFGFMSALGVGLAFVLTIYMLPLMLDIWAPKPIDKSRRFSRFIPDFSTFISGLLDKVLPIVEKSPRTVVVVFLSFFALFIYGATQTRVESDPIGQFPESSPVRQSVAVVDKHMMGTQSLEIYLDLGEENAFQDPFVLNILDKLQQDIEHKYGDLVVRTTSLAEVVKDTYQTLNEGRADMYIIPASQKLVSQTLFMFNNSNPEFRAKVVSDNYNKSHISIRFHNATSSEYVKVFAKLQADADAAVAELSTRYPNTKVSITGMLTLMMQGIEYLTHAQLESFALALVFISIILLVVFGSLRAGSIAIIPNLIPATLAFGLLGLFDIPLDFNTMMIAPVVIGIAVDDTVHFITRYRTEVLIDSDIKRALRTTIKEGGHAIVFTALILGLGFGVFALSSSVGTSNVGTFGSLAIFAGLLNDLFLLPALILIFQVKFDKQKVEPDEDDQTTLLTDPMPQEA